MRYRIRFTAAALLLTVLGACVTMTRYHVEVSSLARTQSPPQATTFLILPGLKDVAIADLQFQEYSSYVAKVLTRKGMREAPKGEVPDVAVFLAYGIGEPQQNTLTYSVPVFGQTGVQSSSTYGTIRSSGSTSTYTGSTYYTPRYGVVGSSTNTRNYTTYFRYALLDAYDARAFVDRKETVQIWKTIVTSTGSSGDLRRLMPVMIVAADQFIGTNTGEQRKVTLFEDGARIESMKAP